MRLDNELTVAVNLSARNLLDRQLPLDVGRVLKRHGLPADLLMLEITETTMMSELDVVEKVLGQLRALGVLLSVDDFGTGYSSLAFLQRVQVNEVKIDRSFVNGLCGSDNDRALVRATVQLAHSLGARCVAEGVETQEQYEALRTLGCDSAQGYFLSRPITANAIGDLLDAGAPDHGALARQEPEPRHLRAVAL
jgi:EAL domain-containing protein (putative c-di-GMP-specific phosphodiesterase class I)